MENETKTTATAETTNDDLELIKQELKALKDENEKLRKANTNASADASKYKKQLQDRMSAEEQAESKRKEETEAMLNELNILKREKAISDHTNQFLSLGFENALARESAEAMVESDFPKVFGCMKAFIETHDKALNAEILKSTPKPSSVGGGDGTISAEQFKNMSVMERMDFQSKFPEQYAQFVKK